MLVKSASKAAVSVLLSAATREAPARAGTIPMATRTAIKARIEAERSLSGVTTVLLLTRRGGRCSKSRDYLLSIAGNVTRAEVSGAVADGVLRVPDFSWTRIPD